MAKTLKARSGSSLRSLLAASEVEGFAKTGGLADVSAALARSLARRGHECVVVLPLYRCCRTGSVPIEPTGLAADIPVGERTVTGRLWKATLPRSAVPVYLVEQPEFFERDDPAQGSSLYQFTLSSGQRLDYPDNGERFLFFARFVLECPRLLNYWPHILHLHDWQCGLAPVFLTEVYAQHSLPELRERYRRIRTVFTIHNLSYQGLFPASFFPKTGLDWRLFNHRQLEFYGQLNYLKAGLVFADRLTTVSPTYAQEIQTPRYGYGLQGILAERRDVLTGIVNGVDYESWSPAVDPNIAANYDADSVELGKPVCKEALQRRFGLPTAPNVPLLGMVARLVEQKGVGLVVEAADALMGDGMQLVVLGEGEPRYQEMLFALANRYPRQVGVTLAFDERTAHEIEAGADIFLMPSLFEPSGLNQLYSLRYGTVPVVRATGGLADTVSPWRPDSRRAATATGFAFEPYTADALVQAVRQAADLYRQHPEQWRQLVRNGMNQDWSWERSAGEYEKVFLSVAEVEQRPPLPLGE